MLVKTADDLEVEIPDQPVFSTRNLDEAVRVMVISRIDYGGLGFRQGLLNLAGEVAQQDHADFIIVAGGIVSHNGLKDRLPKKQNEKERELDTIAEELATRVSREWGSCKLAHCDL